MVKRWDHQLYTKHNDKVNPNIRVKKESHTADNVSIPYGSQSKLQWWWYVVTNEEATFKEQGR